ncbi:MAG: glycosyltransferase family 39 protein [Sedimentisphaerales bacterium]
MANEGLLPGEKKRESSSYFVWVILLLVLLLAVFLRFVNFGKSPPGLNQDEASGAWNAYCLLKTGKDQVGVSWPIFYTRALGENKSTLYMYLLIPFQAIGGLNITTTRLPGAICGVLTVLLIYFVGRRLFDRQTGLMAALLLALNPWHIQQSRWGHEASINALLGLAPLAMLLWANMPVSDNAERRPRPVIAGLAGIVAGICCYGYHAVRVFIPIFLLAVILVTLPAWGRCLKTRRGASAIFAFITGFAVTFGPMAWQHIFHPEGIGRHISYQKMFWNSSGTFTTFLKNVAGRYFPHFGLDFLFINGDPFKIQSPPNMGQFHWYMLPIMIAGLIVILWRLKNSSSARILLVYVIVYPVGDILCPARGMHALRSAPGLCGLVLLGAAGAVMAAGWLLSRRRSVAATAIAIFAIAVVILNVRYLCYFYGDYNRESLIYHGYNVDLLEACEWLKPHLNEVDAVFFTTDSLNMPYVVTLVALGHDPNRWFNEPREFLSGGEWDYCTHYGKMYFIYNPSFTQSFFALQQNSRPSRVIFIVRPDEFDFDKPVHRIFCPDDSEAFVIYELQVPVRKDSGNN